MSHLIGSQENEAAVRDVPLLKYFVLNLKYLTGRQPRIRPSVSTVLPLIIVQESEALQRKNKSSTKTGKRPLLPYANSLFPMEKP